MRLPKLYINAPHDWQSDLSICIKAMTRVIIFCAVVLLLTLAFLPVYHTASDSSQPYDVYSAKDWQVAVNDPFVDVIILHEDVPLINIPNRSITLIKDF